MNPENIKPLPLNGCANSNTDIAAHLREMADWVSAGDMGDISNAFLIFEGTDGTLHRRSCGRPCDRARLIGILQIAAVRAATGDE